MKLNTALAAIVATANLAMAAPQKVAGAITTEQGKELRNQACDEAGLDKFGPECYIPTNDCARKVMSVQGSTEVDYRECLREKIEAHHISEGRGPRRR